MVRVYMARISGDSQQYKEQSMWAYRLLEQALLQEYPEIDAPVCVRKDAKGKPFLPDYPQIHFNLSHSGCLVACAIGEKPVGVDLEVWKARKNPERIVEKMHPAERELYANVQEVEAKGILPKGSLQKLFYELWVLKESFLKAEGSGMRIDLAQFSVSDVLQEVFENKKAAETVVKGKNSGEIVHTLNARSYYGRVYELPQICGSLAVCSEEKEMEEQAVWLTLPE